MADPTNPEDTASAFDALNETLRQVQESMAAMSGAIQESVAATKSDISERKKAADLDIATRKQKSDEAKKAADDAKKAADDAKKVAEASKALNDQVKRLQDAYGDAYEIQGKLNDKGEKEIKVLDKAAAQRERETQLNNEIYAQVKERLKLTDSVTQAEKEAYILAEKEIIQQKKSQKIYEDQIKQLGYMFDQNGKIIKQSKLLTDDQDKVIKNLKKYEQAHQNVSDALQNLGNDLLKLSITSAFDLLKASVVGTYKAQVAYEDALIAGERGRSVEAAAINARMQEMAGALDGLGGGLVSMGAQVAATGLQMALLGGPIGLVAIAIGGLLAVLGYAAKIESENIKRTAELRKKQAELFDTLFKDFGALGDASMVGARGMTGIKDDLAKVGLSIKEFDKLNKVLSANAKEIAMFGASTVNGVKSFIEVTGGLINSELGKTFEAMGITQEAQIAHTQKYMAMEARFGTLQEKSIKDQVKAAGQYVVELDKMAALTGATRKEQEQAREAVMAIAQLRAALFEAKEKAKTGDPEAKAKVEELERAVKVSTTLMNAGQKDLAQGVAEYSATGGPTSEAAARAMQALPQVLESIKSGKGTDVTRTQEIGSDLKKFLGQYAGTMKYTGAIAGLYQDSLGEADDFITRMEGMEKAKREFEAKPENKGKEFDPDKYLAEARKNEDPETKKQVEIERENRKKALEIQEKILAGQELASQTMLTAGGVFDTAAKLFREAVDKLINWFKEFFNWGTEKTQTTMAPRMGDQGQLVGGAMGEGDGGAIMEAARDGAADRSNKPSTSGTKAGTMDGYVGRGQTAPEAPKKELGGIVPGTIDGTTVTVGEKGKPEAIMPLDTLSGMLNTNTKSSSTVDKFAGMVDINKDLFNINAKDFEISVKQFDLAKVDTNLKELSNKLTEKQTDIIDEKLIKSMNAETDTTNKLIISMNKVTDMLPNTLAQIIAATGGTTGAAGGGPGAAPAGAPTAGGGATAPGSVDSLKQAGLILKKGDVQAEGKEIDPRLIEIAKQVQASVPGFMQFTGFNDEFHNENSPGSKHTKGKAFDFVLNRAPSKEEGAKILAQLKSLGIDYAQDEYNNPSSAATGGHIHGQLNAFDGGVFEPRPGGVHVNLAEAGLREAAVPLNPGEKIRVEKSEQENNPPKKDPLSTVLANDSQSGAKSDQAAQILSALHELMESKFDSMISAIKDGNDISDKLLKYSQV